MSGTTSSKSISANLRERSVVECPRCDSQDVWRNGSNGTGKQQWRCQTCSKHFVEDPYLPASIKTITDRMIRLEIPASNIEKVLEGFVSRRWIFDRKKWLNSAQ